MDDIQISYLEHKNIAERIKRMQFCLETISLEFEQYEEPYVKGPGLYFVVVSSPEVGQYADPMGANYWPVDQCNHVGDIEAFFQTAKDVAASEDGAIVVSVDGTIKRQMVHCKDVSEAEIADNDCVERVEYADWMGSRHRSAASTSVRKEVVVALTLSETDGRVSIFENGTYETIERDEITEKWATSTERLSEDSTVGAKPEVSR